MDVAVKEIEDLMTSQLSPELQDWKRRQQIAAIGGPLLTGLEQLQNWYSECQSHLPRGKIFCSQALPSPLLRFTLTAQSLFQIKRQLDKLGELVMKVTYECDPIPLQKPHLEERVKYLLYHLIRRYDLPGRPQRPLLAGRSSDRRVVCSQLVCGGDAAVHAHTPTETPHRQDRRPVCHQSQVSARA